MRQTTLPCYITNNLYYTLAYYIMLINCELATQLAFKG